MASEANGALWISPNDELLGGESNSMERTFKGQGKALEYCRWGGFFFLLPVDKLRVDQNFFPLVLQGEFSVVVVLPATEPALPMTAMETISSAFLRSSSAISVVQAIFMMDDVMILEQSFCHLVILRILLHWQGCCIMHLHRTNFSVTATKLNNRFFPPFFRRGYLLPIIREKNMKNTCWHRHMFKHLQTLQDCRPLQSCILYDNKSPSLLIPPFFRVAW